MCHRLTFNAAQTGPPECTDFCQPRLEFLYANNRSKSCRAGISQIDLAPIALARLVEDAGESLVGEFGTKDVEGGLDLGIEGFRQDRSKRFGRFGFAPQRLGQSPNETGVLLGA